MPVIELAVTVEAPRERCFDLARDIDLHVRSMESSGERAVAGRTTGRIELGEEVTWEARHFGAVQRFTSRITEFRRPDFFQDVMVRGPFRSFVHDHFFEASGDGGGATRMREVVVFQSPLGILGAFVDALVMKRHLARILGDRQRFVKAVAESAEGAERGDRLR